LEKALLPRLLPVVVALISFNACASSTVINSVPPGAKVYVNGHYLGDAPVTQTDTAVLGTWKNVVLKKEGYKDQTGTIAKEELAIGPAIAGVFLWVPLIWALGYPEQYTFDLEPEQLPSVEREQPAR